MIPIPLKYKVGIYSAVLTSLVMLGAMYFIQREVTADQLRALDEELTDNAAELFRDLRNFKDAPTDPRLPVKQDFIPLALRRRYIDLEGPGGAELYKSKNLQDFDLRVVPDGLHTIVIKGHNCRIGTFRDGPYILHVGTRMGLLESVNKDIREGFTFAFPIVLTLAVIGGILVGASSLGAVGQMTAAAERITAGRPNERLPVPRTGDEIERLSSVLNATFDRLEKARSMTVRLSGDASHQLKTPISVLSIGIENLRDCGYLKPEEHELTHDLIQQIRRLNSLVEDLILLAQMDAGQLTMSITPVDAVPHIWAAADDAEVIGMKDEISLDLELPDELPVMADPRRLDVILQCLFENAVKYNRRDGSIRVATRTEAGNGIITVANTGNMIPPGEHSRIFERFHRGVIGENVKGHGLGLNIARELATAHGGRIQIVRSDGQWNEFELWLPLAKKGKSDTHIT